MGVGLFADGFSVKKLCPEKRGFYGETSNIQTEKGKYLLKFDYWEHHKREFQNSLPVIQHMTDSGITFIPKILRTKDGRLCGSFQKGTAAVFAYIPGQLSEDYSTEQLYRHLAQVYRLKTEGIACKTEDFGIERISVFRHLQSLPELPAKAKAALDSKKECISRYMKRLKQFSEICGENRENFHITHGDAGGNCIKNKNQLFLVDWDTVLLAPIERDAWIFLCDQKELEKVNEVLEENGIHYVLDRDRLCFYCYDFFFHYLNEYLKSIIEAESAGQKEEIVKNLIGYLNDCWIYKRLAQADTVRKSEK